MDLNHMRYDSSMSRCERKKNPKSNYIKIYILKITHKNKPTIDAFNILYKEHINFILDGIILYFESSKLTWEMSENEKFISKTLYMWNKVASFECFYMPVASSNFWSISFSFHSSHTYKHLIKHFFNNNNNKLMIFDLNRCIDCCRCT